MASWKSIALVSVISTVSAATVAVPVHRAALDASASPNPLARPWSRLQLPVAGGDDSPDRRNGEENLSTLIHNLINITIGSQEYEVVLDTSSSMLYMPELVCESTVPPECHDTISVGDLKIKNQAFAGARSGPSYVDFDGILGLAYSPLAEEPLSPLNNMIAQDLIEEPIFSLYLGNSSGEIVFGGMNEEHFTGNLTKLPLNGNAGWQVDLTSFEYGDEGEGEELEGIAIFDSGTTGISLPTQLADVLNVAILFDCSWNTKIPDLKITLAGHEFSVRPEQYLSGRAEDCETKIFGYDHPGGKPLVILGTAFLEGWYSVFNAGDPSVSLARAK